jgi:ferric-dicitrate binding protein FerR (iron transport regulator)
VFVGQNTELQIEEQGTVLDLLLGKIRVLLEKLGPHESEFEVNTPIVITGVRDTEFIVDTTKERTDVLVLEGTVELSDLGRNKTVLVKAGESSMVEAGSLPSEPQKFDSATVFQKYES